MKELHDPKLLTHYLEKYRIPCLFDTPNLPFRLFCYEPGEMMNVLRPTAQYMKFLVQGSFDLYGIRTDGSSFLIRRCEAFGFLGDIEFSGKSYQNRYHEVVVQVHTIELPMEPYREILLNDNRFLRFLLNNVTEKLTHFVLPKSEFPTLQEALLFHLREECPDHSITNVSETAFRLNYSRRQLQRVIKELTGKGLLKKRPQGGYELMQ